MTRTSQEVKQLLWSEVKNPNKILTLFWRSGRRRGKEAKVFKRGACCHAPRIRNKKRRKTSWSLENQWGSMAHSCACRNSFSHTQPHLVYMQTEGGRPPYSRSLQATGNTGMRRAKKEAEKEGKNRRTDAEDSSVSRCVNWEYREPLAMKG